MTQTLEQNVNKSTKSLWDDIADKVVADHVSGDVASYRPDFSTDESRTAIWNSVDRTLNLEGLANNYYGEWRRDNAAHNGIAGWILQIVARQNELDSSNY